MSSIHSSLFGSKRNPIWTYFGSCFCFHRLKASNARDAASIAQAHSDDLQHLKQAHAEVSAQLSETQVQLDQVSA